MVEITFAQIGGKVILGPVKHQFYKMEVKVHYIFDRCEC